ncbi:MAG: MFS transporter [Eubacteriales bacterium]|nr:MFS transporter [Eubacteriales bacterium]
MAEKSSLKEKIMPLIDNVRYYWKEPPKGRYMSFKEIAAYAFGGIGAYFIIAMGSTLVVSTTNMIVGGAIGVGAMDMYYLYVIATLANIPLTAIRANMVDNTRGKAGKYRPYLISMGIPTALISIGYVWFPYEKLGMIFTGEMFGKSGAYVATCAVVLIFNLLLQFFFNFFNDAYTNLIHVLSPNTQERTDVLSIKSVVYSLAPSIMNIVLPLIAQFATNNDLYDLKVYRIGYPIFAILGMALTIVVFANTQEKIVQARTHTIQISFMDSFKAVAKNKYFWIIALAGWMGFLEGAYGNILTWSYNYGHTCNGGTFALIQTLTGNASLWGMILAPICIRKWGKKKVLIGVNFLNIVCIAAMYINMRSIWWLFLCVYFNWLVGAFEQITTPAIQADIRDYQQYRTGERIDGMFATVLTIGNIVTLLTSSILPAVQKYFGVYEGNGYDSPYDILDVTTGEPDLLYKLMGVLIGLAAVGAFMNMVPYFFYDFTEKKQKSVISVLKIRSLFEDYGNNALDNHQIVEAIDLVNYSREMADATPKTVDKSMYKNISDKAERKAAKKEYKAALEFNEQIDISKFVCRELDKFDSSLVIYECGEYEKIVAEGLDGIKNIDIAQCKIDIKNAKKLPKNTEEEKELRTFQLELAKKKKSAKKAYDKYFGTAKVFVEPDMEKLTALFDREDELDEQLYALASEKTMAKKAEDKDEVRRLDEKIKAVKAEIKKVQAESKKMQDEFAEFNRAAKPFTDARKFLVQKENFSHFDEIAALYDDAKAKAEEEDRLHKEELDRKRAEEQAELEKRKAMKAAKKNKK